MTKLGTVVHNQEPEYYTKKICLLIFKVTVTVGADSQNRIASYYIVVEENLPRWSIIMSRAVLGKDLIAVFKFKVTAKVENVSECSSERYLLNG